MEYTFEKLDKDNLSKYFDYLLLATTLEPELMCSSDINKEELYESFQSAKICELPFFIQKVH